MNRVEKFKDEVTSPIYVTFSFELSKNKSKDSYFVFYEGEDRKYYNSRIKKYTNQELLTHDCSGKNGVIEVYENILKRHQNNLIARCMFFVDRDFGLENVPKAIYETPEYSIENFYIKRESLENILKDEFGMTIFSEDYESILLEYTNTFLEFQKKISLVLIWYLACKKNDFDVELEDAFNITSLFELSENKLVSDDILHDAESVIISYETYLKKKIFNNSKKKALYEKDIIIYNEKRHDILQTIKVEEKNYDPIISLRGKYGLDFFQMFLKHILKKHKEGKLQKKYKTVYFNVDSKNLLSVLDKYAVTPSCLITYIQKKVESYKENYISKI